MNENSDCDGCIKKQRPCGGCERVRLDEAYTPDQCRFCWLYHNKDKYRQMWGGDPLLKKKRSIRIKRREVNSLVSTTQSVNPSLVQQAKNYATENAKWVAAGAPKVSDEVYTMRQETCRGDGKEKQPCPHYIAKSDRCKLCGCFCHQTILGDKLRMATAQCPDNPPRWLAVTP